ncbi:MAG TPA: universal stress protein [Terriglobales bacterium]|nr:universal stress protein [Terriglobales bacterium]
MRPTVANEPERRIPPERILLASDFSCVSDTALKYAATFARYFGSRLYVAHVSESKLAATFSPANDPRQASSYFDRGINRLSQENAIIGGVPFSFSSEQGPLWPAISNLIEKNDIDLLVLGSSGRSGLAKLLFGSKADELLIHANCPLLISGPETANENPTGFVPRTILCATDFTVRSKVSADYACRMAEQLHASLLFVHVIDEGSEERLSLKLPPSEFFSERWQENHCAPSHFPSGSIFMVEYGPLEDRIVELANRLSVGLVVLGLNQGSHLPWVTHMPGPRAYDVAAHSCCPVLAVPA